MYSYAGLSLTEILSLCLRVFISLFMGVLRLELVLVLLKHFVGLLVAANMFIGS